MNRLIVRATAFVTSSLLVVGSFSLIAYAQDSAQPSAELIAAIKEILLKNPDSNVSQSQLEIIARQMATQMVKEGKVPAGLVSSSTPTVATQGAQKPATPAGQAGLANCFAYYRFGSVQAKLSTSVASVVSGTPITFAGNLENSNPYPVVDGALYVKIFRYPTGEFNVRNGPDVVDQFFVKEGIAIPAKGSVPVSFEWKVPSYARSGDYSVAAFFTTGHKYNLLGLSFTDDVTGNTERFKVTGERDNGVAFDKDGVTVSGKPYYFAEFPPREDATSPLPIQARIKNTTSKPEIASVRWQLYSWDAQREENLLQESSENVTIRAEESASIAYTLKDASAPVYLLVGTLRWRDTQSVINVRIIRQGLNKLRINFPSIMSFPLLSGQENTLFSCFHNQSDGVVSNGRLELSLKDAGGNTIHEYTYSGAVSGNMAAVADKFTPTRSYDVFDLDAKLYQGQSLVDHATFRYDCKDIDPNSCTPGGTPWQTIAGIGGLLAVLILVFFGYRHFTKRPQIT